MTQKVIIHAGPGKTGTSVIQKALVINRNIIELEKIIQSGI
jgi:hypothetical protein